MKDIVDIYTESGYFNVPDEIIPVVENSLTISLLHDHPDVKDIQLLVNAKTYDVEYIRIVRGDMNRYVNEDYKVIKA